MKNKSPEGASLRVVPTESNQLCEIADALGVPIQALLAPRKPHILHEDAGGMRWLLLHGVQGTPVVRREGHHAAGQSVREESVRDFLTQDQGSLQCQALATLIDRLLVAYLTD